MPLQPGQRTIEFQLFQPVDLHDGPNNAVHWDPPRRRLFKFERRDYREGNLVSIFQEVLEDYPKHRRAGGASTTPPAKAPEPVEAKPGPYSDIVVKRDKAICNAFDGIDLIHGNAPKDSLYDEPSWTHAVTNCAPGIDVTCFEEVKCDCGGEKAKTTHSKWCATNG
jgi:hypothetical protein